MNTVEIYEQRQVIEFPSNLRSSNDLDYVLAKQEELLEFEKKIGEEAVIGVWGYPLPHGRIEGYGLHTRKEYNTIRQDQTRNNTALIFLAPRCYDTKWFERKIKKLKERNPIHS